MTIPQTTILTIFLILLFRFYEFNIINHTLKVLKSTKKSGAKY